MVRQFLYRCFLLGLPILGMLVFYCLPQAAYFPAPRITANLSVNEKIAFAEKHFPEEVDLLAMGSSMTLNNLNSTEVMAHFGNVRYLNASAWGTGASELDVWGPVLAKRFSPKMVIVSTNLMDFAEQPNFLSGDSVALVRSFRESALLGYLRHWNAPYYLREMEANKTRFKDAGNYEYLRYDEHGGVTLSIPPEKISQPRFDIAPITAAELDPERYEAFTRFVEDLSHRSIRLVVFESAYRDGVRTAQSDALQETHVARLRSIIEPLGGILIDANQRRWDDSLFVDSSHYGPEGAKEYTSYCLAQLGEVL